ncbi:MAG: phospholipase D-like domain-containing protein, partial [Anaerolineae bacterium]|nr:phospholipase D-like domain-containing protein [Anaerolineae bacterium]
MRHRARALYLAILLGLFITGLAACDVDLGDVVVIEEGRGALRTPTVPDVRREGSWYEIFFTDPSCPPFEQRIGGLDAIIATDLLQAESRVDIAAFDLDAVPIVEALIALRSRDVAVRVVTDDGYTEAGTTNRLRRNGLSVVEDGRSALMHNKFIVIDEQIVWTGSLNYTSNGAYCNNNNAVRFDVPELAANYTAEMDEMYIARAFGPTSPAWMPHRQIRVNDVLIETYFGPEERIAPAIAAAVESAEEEILFMMFSFTEELIGEAMLGKARQGVTVRGVFEATGSDTAFSYYERMLGERLPHLQVRKDGNPRLLHHKVLIVDRE